MCETSAKRPRLVAFDLDGTALNRDKQLSAATAACIRRGLALGVHMVPATGRSRSGLPAQLLAIGGLRYAVCANGAEVLDLALGTVLHGDYFSAPAALSLLRDCRALGVHAAAVIGGRIFADWTAFETLAGQYPPATLQYLKDTRLPVADLEAAIRESGEPVAKFTMVFPDIAARPRAIALFRARGDCTVSASLETNLEVNTLTANKGAALKALALRLGVERRRVMAVGDGHNDLAMLRFAGMSAAMANGIPEVLKTAGRVTGGCDEDGLAQAVNAALNLQDTP